VNMKNVGEKGGIKKEGKRIKPLCITAVST
jgi:hypothetical protein